MRVARRRKDYIVESLGGGVALLDYDNDGWLDIYLVNGMTYDAMNGKAAAPHAALFHNNHDGTFTNVAAKAGVTNDRWGVGVAVGDYDNDGWPDLYVTNLGKIGSTITITMGPSLTSRRRRASRLAAGQPGPHLEITTATAVWICSCPAIPTTTLTTRPQLDRSLSSRTIASSAASACFVGRAD